MHRREAKKEKETQRNRRILFSLAGEEEWMDKWIHAQCHIEKRYNMHVYRVISVLYVCYPSFLNIICSSKWQCLRLVLVLIFVCALSACLLFLGELVRIFYVIMCLSANKNPLLLLPLLCCSCELNFSFYVSDGC